MEVAIEDGRRMDRFTYRTRVLVDIFRATSTMPLLLRNGAESIIPTETLADAREIKRENPGYVIIGERMGFKVPGFDYGNSPSRLMDIDFTGKTVVFTSTNGTKVLRKIIEGGEVFVASFVNADATFRELSGKDGVSIVASNRPDGRAEEDNIFAEYLMERLQGKEPSLEEYVEKVKKCSGSRWLKIMGFWSDISACLTPNVVDFPVIYRNGRVVRF